MEDYLQLHSYIVLCLQREPFKILTQAIAARKRLPPLKVGHKTIIGSDDMSGPSRDQQLPINQPFLG